MTGDLKDELYLLIAEARKQQEMAAQVIGGLASERGALAHERAALALEREALARDMAAMQQGAQDAVKQAARDCLADSGNVVARHVDRALEPTFHQLKTVVGAAEMLETSFRRVTTWAGRRLFGWGLAFIASVTLLAWLGINGVMWWESARLTRLRAQAAALDAKIDEMTTNSEQWMKTDAIGKISHCGDQNRLCVAVDTRPGSFADKDRIFYVIDGY